jgi:hypothetical protein
LEACIFRADAQFDVCRDEIIQRGRSPALIHLNTTAPNRRKLQANDTFRASPAQPMVSDLEGVKRTTRSRTAMLANLQKMG